MTQNAHPNSFDIDGTPSPADTLAFYQALENPQTAPIITQTRYRYTPQGKADLFAAIKASTSWGAFKAAYKLNKPAYPIRQIERMATLLNINLALYAIK